jgi:hypothetical protein
MSIKQKIKAAFQVEAGPGMKKKSGGAGGGGWGPGSKIEDHPTSLGGPNAKKVEQLNKKLVQLHKQRMRYNPYDDEDGGDAPDRLSDSIQKLERQRDALVDQDDHHVSPDHVKQAKNTLNKLRKKHGVDTKEVRDHHKRPDIGMRPRKPHPKIEQMRKDPEYKKARKTSDWWSSMTQQQKQAYLKDHPNSKQAKK